MSVETVVLPGVVRLDGTLELPENVGLPPGPVEVTVRTLAPPTGEDWFAALQRIRANQEARGHVPRSAEEIDAEIREMRDEWEEHQLAIERLQEECARSRSAGEARALPRTVEVVDSEMAAILRGKSEAERLAIAWGMWRWARSMVANLLRTEHPDWTDAQVNQEIARRFAHGETDSIQRRTT